jgi:predicted RNA binding protein YcfA (HicA-like mRNA interferase family)
MSAYPPNVWSQLKNLSADDLISALKKDGWNFDPASRGAIHGYIKTASPTHRITIHYHPQKTYGPGLLKALLDDIGWTPADMRRLRLIK